MTDLPSDEAAEAIDVVVGPLCLGLASQCREILRTAIHTYLTATDEGRALVRDAERERLRRRETDHITLRVEL